MKLYGIREDYQHRQNPTHHDDRAFADQWQREVYLTARALADASRPDLVVDWGCGSAFKLLSMLGHHQTLGVEVEPCLSQLRLHHPGRQWAAPEEVAADVQAKLVICADVIEHVLDPDALLARLFHLMARDGILVLSTPDRDLVRGPSDLGPPANPCHAREWTMAEFRQYVNRAGWNVLTHSISNHDQGTQVMVCCPW